jgi:hypothetical protein
MSLLLKPCVGDITVSVEPERVQDVIAVEVLVQKLAEARESPVLEINLTLGIVIALVFGMFATVTF